MLQSKPFTETMSFTATVVAVEHTVAVAHTAVVDNTSVKQLTVGCIAVDSVKIAADFLHLDYCSNLVVVELRPVGQHYNVGAADSFSIILSDL